MSDTSPHVHTYPLGGRPHETDGTDCWCGPTVERCCPECDGAARDAAADDCWLCGRVGFIPCPPDPAFVPGPLHVIHQLPPT